MWIARDKNEELYVFADKPILNQDGSIWRPNPDANEFFPDGLNCYEIDPQWYSEVTFENSPKELVIK